MTVRQMEEARRRSKQFETQHDQGYVAIEFATSSWTWGTVRFRHNPSGGPDGYFEFKSPEELLVKLRQLVERRLYDYQQGEDDA